MAVLVPSENLYSSRVPTRKNNNAARRVKKRMSQYPILYPILYTIHSINTVLHCTGYRINLQSSYKLVTI